MRRAGIFHVIDMDRRPRIAVNVALVGQPLLIERPARIHERPAVRSIGAVINETDLLEDIPADHDRAAAHVGLRQQAHAVEGLDPMFLRKGLTLLAEVEARQDAEPLALQMAFGKPPEQFGRHERVVIDLGQQLSVGVR